MLRRTGKKSVSHPSRTKNVAGRQDQAGDDKGGRRAVIGFAASGVQELEAVGLCRLRSPAFARYFLISVRV